MTHTTERSGSCLCGAVRVSIRTGSSNVGACHCNMCRRWGGGPLLAVECNGNEVRLDGVRNISTYGSSEWAERGFCSTCGTHLFYRLRSGQVYSVPAGLLEETDWVLDQQIFVEEKPAYYSFAEKTRNLTGAEVFAEFEAPGSGDNK